jgi:hypothetical protein
VLEARESTRSRRDPCRHTGPARSETRDTLVARRLSFPGFVALVVILILGPAAWAEAPGAKKLIYYGWGIRDTEYVRHHWQEMEAMPFDGGGIMVAVDRQAWQRGFTSTANQLGWCAMGTRTFRIEEFSDAIADLRSARWSRFTDNFLPVMLSGADAAEGLDWFDDARWRTVASNFGVVARIAADGGVKGLIIDPEHYGFSLFSYAQQRKSVNRPFADYAEMARRRGREVMSAIAGPFPNVVLLSLFGYSLPLSELRRAASLEKIDYGLLPAFYDGLLDAMPPSAYLVDGYELAYPFKQRKQFLDGYSRIQEAVKLSGTPERYRARVRGGFGVMLDYQGRANYFTPEELQAALKHALEISDQYVWLYSNGPRFFPPSAITPPYIAALSAARQESGR